MPEAARTSDLVLTLKVGGGTVALPADELVEVVPLGAITRVPNAPPGMVGLSNLRSAVLPIVSLGNLLGHDSVAPTALSRVVVIGRAHSIGLLVDEVGTLGKAGTERQIDVAQLLARDFSTLGRRASRSSAATLPAGVNIAADGRNETALICFLLGNQEYALSLEQVHDVTVLQSGIAELPDTGVAVLGVAMLRNSLTPIVSTSVLLGLPAQKIDVRTSRVIVVRLGSGLVGLLCDGIKEILRVSKTALDPVPLILTRGKGETRIDAICRLPNGRLVSVLATSKLFDAATTERLMAESTNGAGDMKLAETDADKEQFIVFQLGGETYGLPIAAVDEVVRRPENLARVPRAPDFIEGIMNLRGKTIPIIDQRRRFSIAGDSASGSRRVVIVTIAGVQTGFVVDKVSEVLAIDRQELQPAPEFNGDSASVFDRVANIERDGRMILLVDPKALLNLAERDVIKAIGSAGDASAK
jgi:purine-binding chemotaxis protein CheW